MLALSGVHYHPSNANPTNLNGPHWNWMERRSNGSSTTLHAFRTTSDLYMYKKCRVGKSDYVKGAVFCRISADSSYSTALYHKGHISFKKLFITDSKMWFSTLCEDSSLSYLITGVSSVHWLDNHITLDALCACICLDVDEGQYCIFMKRWRRRAKCRATGLLFVLLLL